MIAALFAALGVALVLPFAPALHEAYRRRDAGPLALSDRYREDRRLGPAADARAHPGEAPGAFADAPAVAARDDFAGPAGMVVDHLRVRTVARLGPGSVVRHRLVVGDSAEIGAGSALWGSAEAGDTLWLGGGCRFERLHGRVVCTGAPGASLPPPDVVPARFEIPGAEVAGGRALVRGDLSLPDGAVVDGDLVVLGTLALGVGARVRGAAKARGDLALGPGARIDRGAIAEGDLTIGVGASVGGAAVAEGALRVAEGAHVGSEAAPTTATGRTVALAADVTVYGTVWARESGAVAG